MMAGCELADTPMKTRIAGDLSFNPFRFPFRLSLSLLPCVLIPGSLLRTMSLKLKAKDLFSRETKAVASTAPIAEILSFQKNEQLFLPQDLIEYFKDFNGTSGEYNDRFFCFYSLREFKTLKQKFEGWNGTPKYQGIMQTLREHSNCYVFADYEFHLFAYAIRLYETETSANEVYAIAGEEYRIIANSFTEFIHKYYNDCDDLRF